MKSYFSFFIFLFVSVNIFAQHLSIGGQLIDKENQPIILASISLLKQVDSSLITGTTSDFNGNFKIENLLSGKFIIKVMYLGSEDLYITKELNNESVSLGKLVLKDKSTTLKEVTIETSVIPVIQMGDTTQINARAFKTNLDATSEDLVAKMPGITIQDGKVQAHGEAVQKVLVDGKEFFGDDATATLRNLPAEVVDKIQIFDKKSDQSQFSGFDDGNTTKTINIITRPQFRNGTFGKVYAGYGYDEKWKSGLNLNFFKDKRKITLLASSNNINEQNFSTDDLLGVISSSSSGGGGGGQRVGSMGGPGGGMGGRMMGQQNDGSNFLVDQKSGINTTHSFGVNYVNQWKKVDFAGSYFFNYSDNTSISNLFRKYITTRSEGLTYTEDNTKTSTNMNNRANFKIDWKIDSANSVMLQPKISVQQNNSKTNVLGKNMQSSESISNTNNSYKSNQVGINVSLPILYRHSFAKKGRTLSVNLTPAYNQNKGANYLATSTQYFFDTLSLHELNQLSNLNTQGLSLASNVVYTEPLNQNNALMFSYGDNFNKGNSDKKTYNLTLPNYTYTDFDTVLSNVLNSFYQSHSFGTNYQYQKGKLNFNAGVAYQYADLKAEQSFPYTNGLNKTFSSVLPNVRMMYRFSPKKNLRVFYRSSNNPPSVSQLQNVINNSNPLQLSCGNQNLKQDWQNTLNVHYSSSNTEKSTSLLIMLTGTYTQNYIVNSTYIASADTLIAPGIVLTRGSQLSKPINENGYYTLRSFNNYSFPLKKIKSNLNVNIGGTYTHTPGMVNNRITTTYNSNVVFGLALSSNISERFDFTISSNTTYNNTANSLQVSLNSNYYNQSTKFKIQVMPWKMLVIQTDLTHTYNSGLSSNYNQNYLLWNAAIGYKFLKNNVGELRLSVFDILKQNNSINRNTASTYYEDVKTNVLQQYFMLTFTYNIKQFIEQKGAQK